MTGSVRRAALACALLTTTCMATAALGQTAQHFRTVDANGVDLVHGDRVMAFREGSIGSGSAELALVRRNAWRDSSQWDGIFFRRTTSGLAVTIEVGLPGAIRDTFTGGTASTSYTPTKANGASLIRENWDYVYRAPDGTSVRFVDPLGTGETENPPTNFCSSNAQDTCDMLPVSIRGPNGLETILTWDLAPLPDGWGGYTYDRRLARVTNSFGYAVGFLYESPASYGWHGRTKALFFNDAVSTTTPQASVSYSYPSGSGAGIVDVTDMAGNTWRLTANSIRRPGEANPSFFVTNTSNGYSLVRDGVTTTYARSVTGTTATMTVTNALAQAMTVVSNLAIGRPTSTTDALGRTTSYQYDTSGRLTRVTRPEGNYVQYTYDARGNITQTQFVPKPGSSEPTITTSAVYPSTCTNPLTCNQPTSTTDARGNVTDYAYNSTHGGVTSVTVPAVTIGQSSVRPQTRYEYSQVGTVVLPSGMSACQTTASCTNTADEVRSTIGYDNRGNVVTASVGNSAGTLTASQTMTYDAMGNLLTVDGPLAGSADTVRHRYDAARRRVGTVSPDPDGAGALPPRATRIMYRPDGQVSRAEAGAVNSQSDTDWAAMVVLEQIDVSYDSSHRPIAQSHAASGQMHSVTQTSYDNAGRPECTAVRMNPSTWTALPASACTPAATGSFGPDRISRNVYDSAGQVTQVQTAVGTPLAAAEVTTTYSANGRALAVTDGENNRTSYAYDGHDRLRRTLFPLAAQGSNASNAADHEELGYDAGGNVVSRRNRAGETANYTVDALGRTVLKDLPGSEPDVAYAYDLLGRLTSASQTGHVLSFTYDALGRQLTQTNPMGTIGSTWDLAGRRTRITHPGGYYVDQDYLVTGEMAAIRENGATSGLGVIATFGYDTLGRRTILTRGNGTVTSYAYDPASRLQTLTQNLAGTTYDLTLGFTYNPAGQITSDTRSNDAYSFAPALGTTTTQVNGLNQITANGGISATYDARGNITSEGGRTFSYSSENLLTAFNGHGRTMAFTYDPLMRVYDMTTVGLNPRTFLHDGDDMIVQNMNGNPLVRYVYGPGSDEPLFWRHGTNGSFGWMHADERGSIVAGSDANGNSGTPTSYDEYGNPSVWSDNHGFAGTLILGVSQLHYNRARVYDSRLGRFLQTDPISYGDGMNMYAYVRADPVNYLDPSGLQSVWNIPGVPQELCVSTNNEDGWQTNGDGETVVRADSYSITCYEFLPAYDVAIYAAPPGGRGGAGRSDPCAQQPAPPASRTYTVPPGYRSAGDPQNRLVLDDRGRRVANPQYDRARRETGAPGGRAGIRDLLGPNPSAVATDLAAIAIAAGAVIYAAPATIVGAGMLAAMSGSAAAQELEDTRINCRRSG